MDEMVSAQEQLLDQVLTTLPLAPLPEGFTARVIAQIEQQTHMAPVRFRLDFLDWAVPTFTAVFVLVVWFLLQSTAAAALSGTLAGLNLPGLISMLLSHQMTRLFLLLLLEIYIGAVVGLWLWYDRPMSVVYRS
ncbi:MAG: hypothetical protein KJ069_19705 [Anaerolineae bacterium]|nr:hypothetical protein [Anaerolineae bacterium]